MPRLYLGNLSYDLDEDGLTQELAALGVAATGVKIIRDRETNRPRGFGFVEVEDEAGALEKLQDAVIARRTVNVQVARERERSGPPRGGGGGGRPRRDNADDWGDERRPRGRR